ncbi:uncharacterized protein LOC119784850 [Cyprinodon tularosa]|uniref:uncharacterized protein LOC119784850 n=1 Tax=Cyprinodon tularosa TaxID=77115 RepID=UPI0018E27B65|nr:uncharacterized protein LOC119784850 [Cyprinodon tularosa]
MEGQRQMGKPLQLLITLSLFILTNQFEVRGDVLEKLSFDTAAELHLRGTSDSEIQELQEILSGNSLINKQFLLQKGLDAVLNKQQMEDQWQNVSESSPSFRQEVLVLTGSKDSSDGRMRQESSLDPQKRVPVFLYDQSCFSELDSNTGEETFTQNQQTGSDCSGSSDSLTLKIKPETAADFSNHGNTTLNSGVILFEASMVQGPIEPDQEKPQIYRGIQEPDPVPGSRSPQRPDDPVQLQILMLEDDEVVRTSAASLYAKHPAVSSVHVVDPQQRVHQVKGQPVVLSEHSSLVLVGHGARDRSGEMRISGYTSKDVARIIQNSSRINQKIQTTTVVACEAGSDQRFREALLKELHEAGIETELHLWTAVVQVTESGEVISQDVSADGAQWRSGDDTKKVVLTVGSKGEIRRRKETDHRGREVLTNQTRLLGDPKTDQNHPEGKSWPERPILFIDPKFYKMIDQNKVTEITEDFRMLEAFTWGLFYPEPGAEPEPEANTKNCPKEKNNYAIGNIPRRVALLSDCSCSVLEEEDEEEEDEEEEGDGPQRTGSPHQSKKIVPLIPKMEEIPTRDAGGGRAKPNLPLIAGAALLAFLLCRCLVSQSLEQEEDDGINCPNPRTVFTTWCRRCETNRSRVFIRAEVSVTSL